ncbi:MAG: hypothetical protein ACREMY_12495 [bacterium]
MEAEHPEQKPDTNRHVDARTRANQGAFLAAFVKLPSVTAAAAAAGIGRSTHYDWLKEDAEYRFMWEQTYPIAYDGLEDLAVEAAVLGIEEVTTEDGKVTKVVRRRSERMLELLLRAKKSREYNRSTVSHVGPDGEAPIEINLSAGEVLLSKIAALAVKGAPEEETA